MGGIGAGMKSILFILAVLAIPVQASGHGGGLDSKGCHTNRKTGDYHCHRGSPAVRESVIAPDGAAASSSGRKQSKAFSNCDEARAAGAAPVRRGDPGYGTHLDRDNDGVGC